MALTAKIKLSGGETCTPEEHAARTKALAEEQVKKLRSRGGAFRLVLITPESVEQLYATDNELAGEVFRVRLPGLLEHELSSAQVHDPSKLNGNARGLRILHVVEHGYLKAGDRLTNFKALSLAIGVANPAAYLYQASCRSAGLDGRKATCKGVTFCREEDYAQFVSENANVD